MSLLGHIRACNAHDLANFTPFVIGDLQYGWVRPAVRALLLARSSAFEARGEAVGVAERHQGYEALSAALQEAALALVDAGLVRKMRSEDFPVCRTWGEAPVAAVNRGAVPAFGLPAFGVHLNGWTRRADGRLALWVGVRARDKAVAPGKLDNIVAGGQPIGLSLMENLVKEADEEASIPEAMARQATAVSAISYVMETDAGLKPDTMFCYDLEIPPDFLPVNADGETESFRLMTIDDVLDTIETTDDFKFNVNLAVIDFMMRHGVLTPDDTPDYFAIKRGLVAGL